MELNKYRPTEDSFPIRVLLVDDQPIMLAGLRSILESHGFICRTATSGLEALQSLREPLPDVILSDLKMPGMSGYELLSIVRRRFPDIVLLATSGHIFEETALDGSGSTPFSRRGSTRPKS